MGHEVSRTQQNKLDLPFRVRFCERQYDGSPRWYTPGWSEHVNTVPGANGDLLNREPSVIKAIERAHSRDALYQNSPPVFWSCINPDCALRAWGTIDFSSGEYFYLESEDRRISASLDELPSKQVLTERLKHALKCLALGELDKLQDTCPTCGKKQPVFSVNQISGKWIYVLKEAGSSLTPVFEVWAETPDTGTIYTHYEGGKFNPKRKQAYNGYVQLPDPTSVTWHFFLSPVRLGKKALELLCKSPGEQPNYEAKRDAGSPDEWKVTVNANLQPWVTTVKRKFNIRQCRVGVEIIPLMDPFNWAASVADFDYLPILAAQQILVRDKDEQAKAFITATLDQAVGRDLATLNPPTWKEDPWNLENELATTPPAAKSYDNMACAWIERYKKTLAYLTEQCNFATCRMFYPVRYSLGHRIVELGCQEAANDDPVAFGIGLAHWDHILREMLSTQAGKAFTVYLTENAEAKDRMPAKNVLGGEDVGPGSHAREVLGDSLLAVLIPFQAYLIPTVIRKSKEPADGIIDALKAIDVSAAKLGANEIWAVRDLALDVGGSILDKYKEKLPDAAEADAVRIQCRAGTFEEFMTPFKTMKEVQSVFSLLSNVSKYGKGPGINDTKWDTFSGARAKVETPIKVAGFVAKQGQIAAKAFMTGAAEKVTEKLEKEGLRLSSKELEVLTASRSLQAFRGFAVAGKIFAGPVGLVSGGADLVSEGGQSVDSYRAGDPGAAVAHGVQAAAAVLTIAVAGAECVALVTGAATAAWAGPVGWIAAGLMLIGAGVIAFCSKNDLELYASHCFIGKYYGQGEWGVRTGKGWMGTSSWPSLRYQSNSQIDAPDRYTRQRLALLRMICGFETLIGATTWAGGIIYPGMLPEGSSLDVAITLTPKGRSGPAENYNARIWPEPDQYLWCGQQPAEGGKIEYRMWQGAVQSIYVQATPREIKGDIDYTFKVRIDIDGTGAYTIPIISYLENSTSHVLPSRMKSSEGE